MREEAWIQHAREQVAGLSTVRARTEGALAFLRRQCADSNPHGRYSPEHAAWASGYADAEAGGAQRSTTRHSRAW